MKYELNRSHNGGGVVYVLKVRHLNQHDSSWEIRRCEARLAESVCVVRVDLAYPLIIKGGFSQGEFCKAVEDSLWDPTEGTGCVDTLPSDVF